ncbi:MAG: histidine phosphatase family protein, partial [Eudoraea sp.]|nr:histidine phosphatase family protein [Eudoraea sp.]
AVYSSPANRALHTCMILVRVLGFPFANCTITNALYDFSGVNVQTFVLGLDNSLDTVMIFGHNHAFTELANSWGNEAISNVPTSGLVHLKFAVNQWSDITNGITSMTIFPKHMK